MTQLPLVFLRPGTRARHYLDARRRDMCPVHIARAMEVLHEAPREYVVAAYEPPPLSLPSPLSCLVRDVCDIGQALFGGSKWAYNVTAVFFLLNNTFIQGMHFVLRSLTRWGPHIVWIALHVLVGAKLLNTLTNSAACTIAFSAVATVICFVFTLPRTLSELSHLGLFSAATMGIGKCISGS